MRESASPFGKHAPVRWQLVEDTLIVLRLTLMRGEHVGRLKLDTVRVEEFRSLTYHALVLARGTPSGRIRGNHPYGGTGGLHGFDGFRLLFAAHLFS
jgi:hypothetical protein